MPRGLDLLGALGTVGGRAAAGGAEGLLEGEILKRKFTSEDALTSLRALELMLKQRQLNQPTYQFHNGQMVTIPPMGPPSLTAMPPPPLNELQQAQAASARSSAKLHEAQAGEVGKPKPAQIPAEHAQMFADWKTKHPEGSYLDFYREVIQKPPAASQIPAEHAQMFKDWHGKNPGGSYLDFYNTQLQKPHVSTGRETDAQGNVRAIVTTFNAGTGKYDTHVRNLGAIGKPVRAPAGLTPRETVTTTTKVTPRKPIRGESELAALNASLPEIVNQLSRKPGFTAPGPHVTLPNGQKRLKTDVIKEAYRRLDPPLEVEVFWNGSQFRIARAWEPEQRSPVETTRSTGPPRERDAEDDQ